MYSIDKYFFRGRTIYGNICNKLILKKQSTLSPCNTRNYKSRQKLVLAKQIQALDS